MPRPKDTAPRDGVQTTGAETDAPTPERWVNVTHSGTWKYSAVETSLQRRAVYEQLGAGGLDSFWLARCLLPVVHARVVRRDGSGRRHSTDYLLSVDGSDTDRVVVTDEELTIGDWARRLGMDLSSDRDIIVAAATAIRDMAYRDAAEVEATARPDAQPQDGRLMLPPAECLPTGYLTMPAGVPVDRAREVMREVAAIVAGRPKMALTLGASVFAPFIGPLRRESHWWDLSGASRMGKSTTQALAAAVWGNPRMGTGIVVGWDASTIGTGRHLGQLGILPPFFDERGTAHYSIETWSELVYSTCQGSSRMTAERIGSGTRRSAPWFGTFFTTGNNTLTEGATAGRFAGIPARVIELTTPFTADAGQALRLTRDLLPIAYGWLGPAVLKSVTLPEVRELVDQAAERLGIPEDGGVPGSIAGHLHGAMVGAVLADQVLGTGSLLADAAFKCAAEYLGEHSTPPTSDADRVAEWLAEALVSRRSAWPDAATFAELGLSKVDFGDPTRVPLAQHGYDQQSAGVRSDDGKWLWVFPATWSAMVEALGVDSPAACRELFERKLLHCPAGARARKDWTVQPRIGGGPSARVYQVAMRAFEVGDDGDQAPPNEPDPVEPPLETPAQVVAVEPLPLPTVEVDQVAVPTGGPCPACASVGTWCGLGGVAEVAEPCVVCGDPTNVRSACGVPRTALCPLSTAVDPEPAPPARVENRPGAVPAPRGAHPAAVRRSKRRETGLQALIAAVDAGEPLRLLDALADTFPPLRRDEEAGRMTAPYWRPDWPGMINDVWTVAGWTWQRPYVGDAVVLDRTGAWVGAAASVDIAHGPLEHTGVTEFANLPGFYKVQVHPWTETGMPSPLGSPVADEIWVAHPMAKLLSDLAEAGRWPDLTVLDSYTSAKTARLRKWTDAVQALRRHTIRQYGRQSDQYAAVKEAFGQARSLMLGAVAENGVGRAWRGKIHRPDWAYGIQSLGVTTMWRAADDCRVVCRENPPIAIRNVDELVLPAAALDVVTSTPRPGMTRPAVRLDQDGIELGTFKVKAREVRAA